MPTTIYLDQNIIRFLVRTFPPGVSDASEHQAFERMQAAHPAVRFVTSHWTIIEAARGRDEPRVRDCAKLIASLRALVIRDKSGMAREEMLHYGHMKFCRVEQPVKSMFSESYPQSLYDLGIRHPALVTHSIEEDILQTFKNPQWLEPISVQEAVTPVALKTLAAAKYDKSFTPEMEAESTRQWLRQFFPERDPAGHLIPHKEREHMVAELARDRGGMFQACPSLRVEDQLAEYRTSNRERNPERQDAIDLMMAVPALAYCDAFVSYDGYIAEAAATLARRKTISCCVARLPSEVVERFGI